MILIYLIEICIFSAKSLYYSIISANCHILAQHFHRKFSSFWLGSQKGKNYYQICNYVKLVSSTSQLQHVWSIQLCGAELCLGLLHTRASKSSLVTRAQPEGIDLIYICILKNFHYKLASKVAWKLGPILILSIQRKC